MNYPEKYYYTEEHEWADYDEADSIVTIGITEFAQSELGDIVFLELPDTGEEVDAGDAIGTIEAVKTVADLYSPVSGIVVEVNTALEDSPELINEDPFNEGWILKVQITDSDELTELLSLEDYKGLVD
ncbi:MAG: glycine cleavage system protein GcvH [Candidatus Marinimicrobia bacterium]|nr:glycine cleavage system protein GcvH [Candidatus Neomarinimicrobiota bacterium]MCF7827507.1 glycine cleavage system protein GcvH [Candidatus Neomarinimicrobiota bacterium]MCF7881631.1 glycine cleavage system protein GcvH [Candidatus Neomarinimicrobiota bacterium]